MPLLVARSMRKEEEYAPRALGYYHLLPRVYTRSKIPSPAPNYTPRTKNISISNSLPLLPPHILPTPPRHPPPQLSQRPTQTPSPPPRPLVRSLIRSPPLQRLPLCASLRLNPKQTPPPPIPRSPQTPRTLQILHHSAQRRAQRGREQWAGIPAQAPVLETLVRAQAAELRGRGGR